MKNKKVKSLLFILALLIIGIIGGTVAYFTTANHVVNEFQGLTYDVDIVEESNGTWGTKKVSIVNKDKTPVVVRVAYNELWSKEDSEYGFLTLSNTINGFNVVNKSWTKTWEEDFVLGPDGWYYYKHILDANKSIDLITSIQLNHSLVSDREEYITYDYELNFGFESIQATEEAIKDLWGFDVNISNKNIQWF